MLVLVTTFGGAAAWYWTPRHCGMVGRLTSVCTLRSESAVRYPQTRKSALSNRRTCSLTLYNLQPPDWNMRLTLARGAISPIIATLLLIAIAVAAGIIVYVFTTSIAGNLTQGGGQQVSEQVSMDAYSYPSAGTAPVLVLRDVGSATVTLSQIYFDGNLCQASGATCTAAPTLTTGAGLCSATTLPSTCSTGQYTQTTLATTAQTAGTSHLVRLVTSDGGTFTFSVIVGRSG